MPQHLGPYALVREIGRGGMGVVYLARDSRLNRMVALKTLPEHLAQDSDRLARFEREARILAQLQHSNLAALYGLEEHDGQRYLVLEYVEGETLSQRLDRGALPVDEALELCAQIAAGVESAHEAGVIHRDLKPANVIITPDGKAKVLDFGLAKVIEHASTSGSGASELQTLSVPATPANPTSPGVVMGTAPYMSPEQARGRRVDKRTDVWSFGCVLYECLTGIGPFVGETTTDTIGAILHKDIDFDALPSGTPLRVRELLVRMLQRDRDKRLRDLGDAMLELETARGEVGAASHTGGAKSGPGWGGVVVIAALTAFVASAGVWKLHSAIGRAGEKPQRPSITMKQLTDRAGTELWSSISPDGTMIVYESIDGGDSDIFMQRIGGFNATNLTENSTAEDYAPALSPDGQLVAFRSDRDGGGIFIMGATGESPRRLTDFGFDPTWSPDGEQLAFATEHVINPLSRAAVSELWIVDVASGDTKRISEGDAVHPNWSPSGARIACWRFGQGGQRDLFTIAADGSDLVEVTNDRETDWNPIWSPDGKWLYFSSDRGGSFAIWRIALDESTGIVSGAPEQITTATSAGAGHLSFSRDGKRLTFTSHSARNSLQRLDLDSKTGDPVGAPRTLTPFTTGASMPSISPDGRLVAYCNTGERQEDLFIISSDGTGRRRITNDAAKDRGPVWLSDGTHLAFYSDRNGKYRSWTISADGGGLELLVDDNDGIIVPLLSPDGKFLAGTTYNQESRLLRIDAGADHILQPLPPHPGGLTKSFVLDWSSDSSKLLINWFNEDGITSTLTIFDIESGIHKPIRSTSWQLAARFYSNPRFVLMCITQNIFKLDTETGETQTIYTETRDILRTDGNSIDIAPDDSWICFNKSEVEADIWMIEFEEE